MDRRQLGRQVGVHRHAGIGRLLFFQDPEGNLAGAMQYDANAE